LIITAVIAIRNEAKYLPVTLKNLIDCNINIVILDHESTDCSDEILQCLQAGNVKKVRIPYRGYFSLTDQIKAKCEIIETLETDWVIHQDADEVLESPEPGESLRDGIERIANEGCNAINFNEFVFIPTKSNPSYEGQDFYKSMLDYYFFENKPLRLMRAWKKSKDIQLSDGGHKLTSKNSLVFPGKNFNLRHYIVLSMDHAIQKYSQRTFSPEDLEKGWHSKRLKMPKEPSLPDENFLNRLPSSNSKEFTTANPWKIHFWEL